MNTKALTCKKFNEVHRSWLCSGFFTIYQCKQSAMLVKYKYIISDSLLACKNVMLLNAKVFKKIFIIKWKKS